jgi:hypothetical protein
MMKQEQLDLLELIDAVRERGVLHVRLPDGTEFHLDPHMDARRGFAGLPKQSAAGTVDVLPSEQPRDQLLDDIDAELFGAPLQDRARPK